MTLGAQTVVGSFGLRNATPLRTVPGRWVALEPDPIEPPAKLFQRAKVRLSELQALNQKALKKSVEIEGRGFEIIGICFKEEVNYLDAQNNDGWIFLINKKGASGTDVELLRGYRIDDSLNMRSEVQPQLRQTKVLLTGCGAIGSFVAQELARAGVGELSLLDHDVVEPGNSVRWVLGQKWWGFNKTDALAQHLGLNYPGTKVHIIDYQIGAATSSERVAGKVKESPVAVLHRMISEVDLVIDTTASPACQAALADLCNRSDTKLVIGYATEGALGGVVGLPGSSTQACWSCILCAFQEGRLPQPPRSEGKRHLNGCNSPTFTGESVDLQEVSLQVTRTAFSILAPKIVGPVGWNVAVLSLLDQEGNRTPPTWTVHDVQKSEACSCCPTK